MRCKRLFRALDKRQSNISPEEIKRTTKKLIIKLPLRRVNCISSQRVSKRWNFILVSWSHSMEQWGYKLFEMLWHYIMSSPLVTIHSLSLVSVGNVSNTPMASKICRCSSLLCKMTSYLRRTYTHPHVYSKTSLDYL